MYPTSVDVHVATRRAAPHGRAGGRASGRRSPHPTSSSATGRCRGGERAAAELLNGDEPPTAVLAALDEMAVGALCAAA
ncbi:hypothetical protein SAMN05661080_04698 [Modestobacter sp. DSM 44400]|nr:hypothetical protein SAMN05661080_04698 [Modestobacter sp. DSM 44400]